MPIEKVPSYFMISRKIGEMLKQLVQNNAEYGLNKTQIISAIIEKAYRENWRFSVEPLRKKSRQ